MITDVNALPHYVLNNLDSPHAILFCSQDESDLVKVTRSLSPADLIPLSGVQVLCNIRRNERVHSLTLTLIKLDETSVRQAAEGFEDSSNIRAELESLVKKAKDVYVVYTITHFNSKPLDELTIFIGGDCYRKDQLSLAAILERTYQLSGAMVRKSVMIFPDIPALHGGKKGEWIVLDRNGVKIEGISDRAVVALGSIVLPIGIGFVNQLKETRCREKGIFQEFPRRNLIRPDTVSPDVLSGEHWKEMCEVWAHRGLELSHLTCVPSSLGGPLSPSSRPTGYGIATTAVRLAESRFKGRDISQIRFILEALGGVGINAIEALTQIFKVPVQNIFAFDPRTDACQRARDKFHLPNVLALSHSQFYQTALSQSHSDVWVNNGLGGNTCPEHVQRLLDSGVAVFCGAANNILEVNSRDKSLQKIFDAGAWIWPDEAASGGGWTSAVLDLYNRCQGLKANDQTTDHRILNTIMARNETLVRDVLGTLDDGIPTGKAVWERINQLIDERVAKTLSLSIPSKRLLQTADVTHWSL